MKRLLENAVKAMQLYCGSVGYVRLRDEQRLYARARRAVSRVVAKTKMSETEAHRQILSEARRRGCIRPTPGKDF
jgi:hypothetical protein